MAGATGLSSLSGPAALVLLLPMEAGIPVPLPADLVMFTVGERVGAGKIPLWLAVTGFEVVAVAGTAALFLACRGPAQRLIARFGPRIGLTRARLDRATALAESRAAPRARRGTRHPWTAHAHRDRRGRLRAARTARAPRADPWQQRVPPGAPGPRPAARAAGRPGLRPGQGPALAVGAVLVAGTVAFWLIRRRSRGASTAWTEASCPVCMGVTLLTDRIPALAGLGDLAAVDARHAMDAAPEGVTRRTGSR